ncbi:hypothetical protein ACOME3_009024 [Neoechinorhynchus agilis]
MEYSDQTAPVSEAPAPLAPSVALVEVGEQLPKDQINVGNQRRGSLRSAQQANLDQTITGLRRPKRTVLDVYNNFNNGSSLKFGTASVMTSNVCLPVPYQSVERRPTFFRAWRTEPHTYMPVLHRRQATGNFYWNFGVKALVEMGIGRTVTREQHVQLSSVELNPQYNLRIIFCQSPLYNPNIAPLVAGLTSTPGLYDTSHGTRMLHEAVHWALHTLPIANNVVTAVSYSPADGAAESEMLTSLANGVRSGVLVVDNVKFSVDQLNVLALAANEFPRFAVTAPGHPALIQAVTIPAVPLIILFRGGQAIVPPAILPQFATVKETIIKLM